MQARCFPIALYLLMLGCSDPNGGSPAVPPDTDASAIADAPTDVPQEDAKTVVEPPSVVEWAGVTVAAAELKAEPAIEAPNLALLASGTSVTVRERRGGWYRIATTSGSGWVRMLQIQQSGSPASTRELERAVEIATGRGGSDNVVITTGIRGFDAQALATAEPDWAAVAYLEGFAATRSEAAAAARAVGLKSHNIKYLPQPKQ